MLRLWMGIKMEMEVGMGKLGKTASQMNIWGEARYL
jgi:hypothetical protein